MSPLPSNSNNGFNEANFLKRSIMLINKSTNLEICLLCDEVWKRKRRKGSITRKEWKEVGVDMKVSCWFVVCPLSIVPLDKKRSIPFFQVALFKISELSSLQCFPIDFSFCFVSWWFRANEKKCAPPPLAARLLLCMRMTFLFHFCFVSSIWFSLEIVDYVYKLKKRGQNWECTRQTFD